MVFEMKLDAIPFYATKKGLKTIEVRLNDEKRDKISAGDTIVFESPEKEILNVLVVRKTKYLNIEELSRSENFLKTGGIYQSESEWINHIYKYYPKNLQEERGLLAIEVKTFI